jgi:hypothetical protein
MPAVTGDVRIRGDDLEVISHHLSAVTGEIESVYLATVQTVT